MKRTASKGLFTYIVSAKFWGVPLLEKMIIRNLQPYRTYMCYSVKTIIVWGQRGHKEAVVKGMTALVIYRGPKHPAVLSPSSSLPLYSCWCCMVVQQSWAEHWWCCKKTCFGLWDPRGGGGQALQCCLGASLQITFQKLFMKYSRLEPPIPHSKKYNI